MKNAQWMKVVMLVATTAGVAACGSPIDDGVYVVASQVGADSCLGGPWPGERAVDTWEIRDGGDAVVLPTGDRLHRSNSDAGEPLVYRVGGLRTTYCTDGLVTLTLDPYDEAASATTTDEKAWFGGTWQQDCQIPDGSRCTMTMHIQSPPPPAKRDPVSLEQLVQLSGWLDGGGY